METTRYVGRVGALAVALGIGTAMAAGHGVAWAETESGGGNTSSQDGGSSGGDSGTTTNGTSARTTKATDRLRKDVQDTVDKVRKGMQSSADRARNSAEDGASKLRKKLADAAAQAVKRAEDSAKAADEVDNSLELAEQVEAAAPKPPATDPFAAIRAATAPAAPGASAGPSRRNTHPVQTITRTDPSVQATKPVTRLQAAAESVTERGAQALSSAGTSITTATASITSVPASSATTFIQAVDAGATASTTEVAAVPKLVSGFLAVVGLAPLAGNSPLAPQSPGLWALLAWARRESANALNPSGTQELVSEANPSVTQSALLATTSVSDQMTAKPATPNPVITQSIDWVTGQVGVANTPGVTNNNPGNPAVATPGAYGIAGTDLGVMWDDGAGHVLMLFGDTFSQPGMTGDWRSNVLTRSTDTDLSDGLSIQDVLINAGGTGNPADNQWSNDWGAAQAIRDPRFLGLFGSTTTIIPTSAISIDQVDPVTGETKTVQYATVMSVRTWDNPGSWTTNWSAIAVSEDGGQTWTVDKDTVRASGWLRSSTPYRPGDQNFQQNALVMADDPNDPYVYVYGTPSGRQGSAYLARVEKDKITELNSYQYFAGENADGSAKWVNNDPSAAVPVFGENNYLSFLQDTGILGQILKPAVDFLNGIVVGGLPTGGNVSEMSVQYNEYLDRYVVVYTDGGNNVVMRVSESPQGQWSDTRVLVANNGAIDPNLGVARSGMYGPMIHPWSGTGQLGNDNMLYYNLSFWGPYNAALMQTDLTPLKEQYNPDTIAV